MSEYDDILSDYQSDTAGLEDVPEDPSLGMFSAGSSEEDLLKVLVDTENKAAEYRAKNNFTTTTRELLQVYGEIRKFEGKGRTVAVVDSSFGPIELPNVVVEGVFNNPYWEKYKNASYSSLKKYSLNSTLLGSLEDPLEAAAIKARLGYLTDVRHKKLRQYEIIAEARRVREGAMNPNSAYHKRMMKKQELERIKAEEKKAKEEEKLRLKLERERRGRRKERWRSTWELERRIKKYIEETETNLEKLKDLLAKFSDNPKAFREKCTDFITEMRSNYREVTNAIKDNTLEVESKRDEEFEQKQKEIVESFEERRIGTKLSFEEARDRVRRLYLRSYTDYKAWWELNRPDWIAKFPHRSYYREWDGWRDFLYFDAADIPDEISDTYGADEYEKDMMTEATKKKVRPYLDAASWARNFKLKSSREWFDFVAAQGANFPLDIPTKPNETYDTWISWGHFLGYDTLETLAVEKAVEYAVKIVYIIRYHHMPANVYTITTLDEGYYQLREMQRQTPFEIIRVYRYEADKMDYFNNVVNHFSKEYDYDHTLRSCFNIHEITWETDQFMNALPIDRM